MIDQFRTASATASGDPAANGGPADPLVILSEAVAARARMCNLVEGIADALPDPPSFLCLRAASILQNDLPIYYADIDRCLIPQLRQRHGETNWIGRVLNQFEADYVQFESVIGEVIELLERIGTGRAQKTERFAAGYALRTFFEDLRRLMGWEENIVLPLARESLAAEDIAAIADGIAGNRRMQRSRPILRAAGTTE